MHNMYKCPACKKIVPRESTKAWMRSYCEETGKMTRLMRVKINTDLGERLFDTIVKLQTGYFDKADVARFSPDDPKRPGVSIMAIQKCHENDDPVLVSQALKRLESAGRISAKYGEDLFIYFYAND